MKAVFLRMLDDSDKATALHAAVNEPDSARRTDVNLQEFLAVPGAPFAYWMSQSLRRLFVDLPRFEAKDRQAVVGLKTSDDFRFVRTHWEVPILPAPERRWVPFAKGGRFSRFFVDIPTVVDWLDNGAQSWAYYEANRARTGGMVKNPSFYFKPGVTWILRSHRFAPQALPAGCIFSLRSYCAFTPTDELLPTLAIFSSAAFDYLFKTTLGRYAYPEFIVGALLRLPWATATADVKATLSRLALEAWALEKESAAAIETSSVFVLPALLQVQGQTLHDRYRHVLDGERTRAADLDRIQRQIDDHCFRLYQISDADRVIMLAGGAIGDDPLDDEAERDAENEADVAVDRLNSLSVDLVSWAVGVAFGRFDIRLAIGTRTTTSASDPFAPVSLRSPGMRESTSTPAGREILVDDVGHRDDLQGLVFSTLTELFGERSDQWMTDLSAVMDIGSHNTRRWLSERFFEYHLQRYSKSKRKAPIYWQVAVPSKRYSVWLYAHQLSKDSIFRLLNDFVLPKLMHEEGKLQIHLSGGETGELNRRDELNSQEQFVTELRTMAGEIRRVAPLWKPNLNDGIVLAMAPLWRLVPQNKEWQKELKGAWQDLQTGKYDWAAIAMHLWPERVIPKCEQDRSLAIVHGLQNEFWFEDEAGKWKPRKSPLHPTDELIAERTSAAVKDALKNFLDAPEPVGPGKRTRKSKVS